MIYMISILLIVIIVFINVCLFSIFRYLQTSSPVSEGGVCGPGLMGRPCLSLHLTNKKES